MIPFVFKSREQREAGSLHTWGSNLKAVLYAFGPGHQEVKR